VVEGEQQEDRERSWSLVFETGWLSYSLCEEPSEKGIFTTWSVLRRGGEMSEETGVWEVVVEGGRKSELDERGPSLSQIFTFFPCFSSRR